MGYDAFISYSHGVDARRAEELQRGLRRFAKPLFRRHALRVFRDETGLAANPALWSSIQAAMDDSDHLVLLCSPEAAASPWVGREIEHWTETKSPERILPVLTSGALVWDEKAGRFDPLRSTAAHPKLLNAFTEEPRFVDLRWARHEMQLTLANGGFRDAVADLAAPMHGIAKDELIGEDIRQHRRTLRYTWGAAVALFLLALGTVVGAVVAVSQAREAQRRAEEQVQTELALEEVEAELATTEEDLADRQATLQQTIDDLTDARAELDSASSDLAAATDERDAAREEADAARVEAAEAGREATRQTELASLANKARVSAEQAAVGARAAADIADAFRRFAENRQQMAEQRQLQAEAAAEQAGALLDVANAELGRTNADLARASEDLTLTRAQLGEAQADARSTTLGVESTRELASNLDRALLLANEASQSDASAAVAAAVNGPTGTIGPMLDAVSEAGSVNGFFRFTEDDRPQLFGAVAISADGSSVVAAESSAALRFGPVGSGGGARLMAWVGDVGAVTEADGFTLGTGLSCVSHLEWLANGYVVSVEHPTGCLSPDVIAEDNRGIDFISTRVRVWDPATPQGPIATFDDAISGMGRPPIEVTSDGRFLSFALLRHDLPQPDDALPITDTIVFDSVTGSAVIVPVSVPQGMYHESAFSPTERYLAIDALKEEGNQAVGLVFLIDLDTWAVAPVCADPLVALLLEADWDVCFDVEIIPIDTAGMRGQLRLDWFSRDEPDDLVAIGEAFNDDFDDPVATLRFFDTATGEEDESLRRCTDNMGCGGQAGGLPGYVGASASLGTRGAIIALTPTGQVAYVFDPFDPAPFTEVVSARSGCAFSELDVSSAGNVLLVGQGCPSGGRAASTMYVAMTDNGPRPAEELSGVVVHVTDSGEFVVTQTLEVTNGPVFQSLLWELRPDIPARLADARIGQAVASRDSSVIAVVRPPLVTESPAAVEIWRLRQGINTSERLPGSVGVAAVDFGQFNDLVGFGSSAPAQWDLGATFHDVTYSVPAVAADTCATDRRVPALLRTSGTGDGTYAVSLDARTIQVLVPGKGSTPVFSLPLAADERIQFIAFSRDGRFLRVGIESLPSNPCNGGTVLGSFVVRVRDAPGAPLAAPVLSQRFPEVAVATSAGGSRILFRTVDDAQLVVRSTSDLSFELARFSTAALPNTFGPTVFTLEGLGELAAGTNSAGQAVVWSAADGSVVASMSVPNVQATADLPLLGVAFSPDGTELAVKTVDQQLGVFEVATSAQRIVRQVPFDAVARVVYSPDGSLIAVDGTYLFDAESLRRVGPRLRPAAWDTPGLDFGSAATYFASGFDGSVHLVVERTDQTSSVRWRIDVDGLRSRSCALAGRNLTDREASLYDVAPAPHKTCPDLP